MIGRILLSNWVPIAFLTLHQAANPRGPAFFGHDPLPDHPGRIVPHMLAMATFQLCRPMTFFILIKTDYGSLHHTPSPDIQ